MIVVFILIGILGLSLLVAIHEFGHLLAAKACGIEVEVFSIGWGPRLIGFSKGGTVYQLAAFPLGGYVRMKGEEDMKSALIENKEHIDPSPGSFFAAAPWKRVIVAAAGPLVNLIFAAIVLGFLFMPSVETKNPPPKIVLLSDYPQWSGLDPNSIPELFSKSSPATKAGLKTGDTIINVDGTEVKDFYDLTRILSQAPSLGKDSLKVGYLRDNQQRETEVVPRLNTEHGQGQIGIWTFEEPILDELTEEAREAGFQSGDRIVKVDGSPVANSVEVRLAIARNTQSSVRFELVRNGRTEIITTTPKFLNTIAYFPFQYPGVITKTEPMAFFPAMARGWNETVHTLQVIVGSFRLFSKGLNPTQAVSGPFRTTFTIGQAVTEELKRGFGAGLRVFFNLLAIISIALFFGNLLPIPALDGGQIILYTIESIRRKPTSLKVIRRYNMIGFILIVLLLGLALVGDAIFVPKAFQ